MGLFKGIRRGLRSLFGGDPDGLSIEESKSRGKAGAGGLFGNAGAKTVNRGLSGVDDDRIGDIGDRFGAASAFLDGDLIGGASMLNDERRLRELGYRKIGGKWVLGSPGVGDGVRPDKGANLFTRGF